MSVRWSLKPTNIQGGNWRLLWRMSFIGEHDNYYGDEKHISDMSNYAAIQTFSHFLCSLMRCCCVKAVSFGLLVRRQLSSWLWLRCLSRLKMLGESSVCCHKVQETLFICVWTSTATMWQQVSSLFVCDSDEKPIWICGKDNRNFLFQKSTHSPQQASCRNISDPIFIPDLCSYKST